MEDKLSEFVFKKLSQRFEHLLNCFLFLFHIWMNVEIERCADVGMPE